MSMSTTRSLRNRSSRFSSPATFADQPAPPKPAESQRFNHGGQANLERWVEPVVRNPVASFEDTKGLERVGVLEHMAPLGVPPSQKLLQKLKVNLNRSSPRITPINTEETTPPMESGRIETASPVDVEPLPEPIRIEESAAISSPSRGRPAKKELDEMRQVIDITTPSPVKTTFGSVQSTPRPQSIQDYIRQDRMKGVIDRAITEAQSQSDLKVVPGLQLLWEDAKTNPQLWNVLDGIINKTPTNAQFGIFKRYIKRGIKHYRKASSGENTVQNTNHLTSPQPPPTNFMNTFPIHTSIIGHPPLSAYSTSSPIRFQPSAIPPMSPIYQDLMSPTAKLTSFPTDTEVRSSTKRKRSHSHSSTSTLSSAKSMPEDFAAETIEVEADGEPAEGRPVRSTGQRQATNRISAGSRTRSSVLPLPETSQPTSGNSISIKPVSKKPKVVQKKDDPSYDSDKIDAKRREFQTQSLQDYNNIQRPESNERTIVEGQSPPEDAAITHVPPPVIHPYSLQATSVSVLSPTEPQARPDLPLTNGTAKKRPYDEIDKEDLESITPLSSSPAPVLALPPPDMMNSTRGATPRSGRLPPPNKARKSARVMVSPNKPKNGGITAGISRAGAQRDSMIGNGADSGAEDNDEFCASCGGEGTLLCCDGCPNSFHHGCLEPPLDPDQEVDGEWYCPRCIARRNKEPLPATGLMGQIIRRVDHTIPRAYSLPFEIRDYFEGVKTGDEGEYEEIGLPRTQNTGAKMNRAGFFEEPSYKELRDGKGNFIVCYHCQETSNGRDIIPCDYCPAKWHMDCVDPPLAVPPRRRGGDKPTGYWRCPLHTEGDLAEIGRQIEAAPGDLGRIPRLRKPKKAIPIDVDLSRGFRNNGIIEVELMRDEMPDIREVALDNGIYRLPEKGIRLDFIDRVKKSWYEDQVFPQQFHSATRIRSRLYRPDDPVLHHPAAYTVVKHKEPEFFKGAAAISVAETARTNARLRHKSFKEQSAVMSLIDLSHRRQNQYSIDPLADLTNALVADAPNEVTEIINSSEKETLLKLQRLVNGRLAILEERDTAKATKLAKRAASEPSLLNGDLSEQINGDADDEDDGASDNDVIS